MEREFAMNKDVIAKIVGHAMLDRQFAELLGNSPQAAAQSIGESLSSEDLEALKTVSMPQVVAASELIARQKGAAPLLDQQQQQGARTLQDFVALLDQQQQQGARRALEALAPLLDQQQQQGTRRPTEAPAPLLDQQHQQGTRRAPDALAPLLDQQQQQGARRLGNLISRLL